MDTGIHSQLQVFSNSWPHLADAINSRASDIDPTLLLRTVEGPDRALFHTLFTCFEEKIETLTAECDADLARARGT